MVTRSLLLYGALTRAQTDYRVLTDTAPGADSRLRIIPRPDHNVSRSLISKNALKVLYRLKDAGFQAFVVGGAVRDILLGMQPKDFDIATDAHPDEVDALFRNSRLIGRRFRLAHVRFGRDVIEVATFRATATEADTDAGHTAHDDEGRILRDNVYGSIDEDVWRRDFTANALYYNIADFSIWDYVGGFDDVRAQRLKLIGDPVQRLREDPVRMLRAARFAGKLGFTLDPALEAAIPETRELLVNVPAARLFDEFLKLFQHGHSVRTYTLLREYSLFRMLFPDTAAALDDDPDGRFQAFIEAGLGSTDSRIADGRSVTPMFLLGVFLWEPVRRAAAQLTEQEGVTPAQALGAAAQDIVWRQQSRISLPKRFSMPMREMLAMQPRFEKTKGVRALNLLEHRRFRAAYDFYLLRAEVGDADPDNAEFWTEVQTLPEEQRAERFDVKRKAPSAGARRRSGRRRRRRKAGAS